MTVWIPGEYADALIKAAEMHGYDPIREKWRSVRCVRLELMMEGFWVLILALVCSR